MNFINSFLIREPLTIISIILYGGLFLYIVLQLILVLVYGHKKWCYRTALLFSCCIWALLRITLFVYYCNLEHKHADEVIPELSRHVKTGGYFLLFSVPVVLQFFGLSLLVSYFSRIVRSSQNGYNPRHWRRLSHTTMFIVTGNIIMLAVNLICAIFIKSYEEQIPISPRHIEATSNMSLDGVPQFLSIVVCIRVVVNGLLFLSMSTALAFLIVRVAKTAEVRLLLETEDMTPSGARSVGLVLVVLFLCRTTANILALLPYVNWIYDTDQIDLLSDSEYGYYNFIGVLFFWEYLPTAASVYFFRVKKPVISSYPPIMEHIHRSGAVNHSDDEDDERLLAHSDVRYGLSFYQATDVWHGSSDSGQSSLGVYDASAHRIYCYSCSNSYTFI